MSDEQDKAIKALVAAAKKAGRAHMQVKYVVTYENDNGETINDTGTNA